MMMLFRVTICWLLLISLFPAGSRAALLFNLDFNQDGVYESSWPLSQDDTVNVDVYVSAVPEPGLLSMGFALQYDRSRLQPVQEQTLINTDLWLAAPNGVTFDSDTGTVTMAGFQMGAGISGNDILLGRFSFLCLSQGGSDLFVLPVAAENFDGFVDTAGAVLDGDLGAGINAGSFYDSADLVLAVQDVPNYVLTDGTLRYALTLDNGGPTGAEAVVLNDSTAELINKKYSLDGGAIWLDRPATLALGFLGLGSTLEIDLKGEVSVTDPGQVDIIDTITSATPDPDMANNSINAITQAIRRGDFSNDGQIGLDDALLVLQILASQSPGNVLPEADANGDARVGLEDAVYLLGVLAGLRD